MGGIGQSDSVWVGNSLQKALQISFDIVYILPQVMSTKSDIFLLVDFLATRLLVEFLRATMMPGLIDRALHSRVSSRAFHLIYVSLV